MRVIAGPRLIRVALADPQGVIAKDAAALDHEFLPRATKEWMAHLTLGGFGAVLDLGHHLGLHSDRLVGDALRIGLCLPD